MIRFLAFSGILFFFLSAALVRAEQSSLVTVLDLTEVERGYIPQDRPTDQGLVLRRGHEGWRRNPERSRLAELQ